MQTTIIKTAAVTLVALALTGCSMPLTGTSGDSRAAEKAERVAFRTRVHCEHTGSQAYGCYLPETDSSFPFDAGCIASGGGSSESFYSCFSPQFKGACVRRRGNRFTVIPIDTVPSPCLHHTIYEPVAVPNGVVVVENWEFDADSCPGQGSSEIQTCDAPLWIGADVRVCSRVAPWDVEPEDFTVNTVDGRSFTASPGSDGDPFYGEVITAGHCVDGSLTFGPIGAAVADAYNPPTFVFQQHGQAAVDWTDPPQPGP
jgi:hypothetical protein